MNRIKMYINGLGRSTRVLILALAIVIAGAGVTQAATTISTNILTNGTLGATGVSTFGGSASTTISVAGVLTSPSVIVTGTASTSSLKVGDELASTINGLEFGGCILAAVDVSAASTTYSNCTGATGVISGDRVFVQATSSLPIATVITAASSTGTAGTISVRFHASNGATTLGANSVYLNFWAVR